MKSISTYIQKGSDHADPKWKRLALLTVRRVALKHETFTAADVEERLCTYKLKTHDLRAMGGVMIEARKAGIVESAGLTRRNDRHTRAATTVWRSLIYKQPSAPGEPPADVRPPDSAMPKKPPVSTTVRTAIIPSRQKVTA